MDAYGNEAFAKQTIEQVDNTPPQFLVVPVNLIVPCGHTADFGIPTVQDNCGSIIMTHEDATNEDVEGHHVTRTWTAIDDAGNVSRAAQTISYELDNEAPVFTEVPASEAIDCSDSAVFGQPQVTDNCSDAIVTYQDVQNSGDCNTGYTFTRVWTARDNAGNESTASQTFTVDKDESAPIFTFVPQDQALTCGETLAFGVAEAVDNCSNANLTFEDAMHTEGRLEVHVRTWTAIDDCGNEAQVSQRITIEDTDAPNILFTPEDKSINCGQEVAFDAPVAEDNCGDVSMSFVDGEVALNCGNAISRKWTITDQSGNEVHVTQTITVVDNTAPTFLIVPDAATFSCGEPMNIAQPTVNDNCSEVTVTYEDEALTEDCSSGFQFRRVWTATDACGNVAMASQEFGSAPDETAPVFTGVLEEKVALCGDAMAFDTPEAIDNCSEVTLKYDTEELFVGCERVVLRTWTASDLCGNAAMTTQRVRFVDNTAPVVDIPESLSMSFNYFEDWTLPLEDVVDDCSDVVTEVLEEVHQNEEELKFVYGITATDACGNMTQHTVTVNITNYDPNKIYLDPDDVTNNDQNDGRTEDGGRGSNLVTTNPVTGAPTASNSNNDISYQDKFMRLSPNPTHGQMDLHFTVHQSERSQIIIYDLLGRRLQERTVDNLKGLNKVKLNVNNFPSGTYLIHLDTGEHQHNQKFIKVD